MISIITTSYNYSKYITQTIESVLAQTYSDWELIIVDDCSNDNSVELIKQFSDDKIKLIINDKNLGLKNSILKGLELARGEWVAFLESDDSFTPNAIERRLATIKDNPNIDLIFNDVELFGDNDWINEVQKQIEANRKFLSKQVFPKNIFKNFSLHNTIPSFSSVMIKRNKLKPEFFNTPVDALLDWWLYIHVTYKSESYYLAEKLTNWRIHSKSYIKTPHKHSFCLVNVLAYIDIDDPTLFPFICLTTIKMCFIRLRVYYIELIRKIKPIFRLKKKKSPLFDD